MRPLVPVLERAANAAGATPAAINERLTVWVRVVRDLGFPIVLSFVLLWSQLKVLPERMDEVVAQMRENSASQRKVLDALTKLIERQR